MKIKTKKIKIFSFIGLYILFIAVSYSTGFEPGKEIGKNFGFFTVDTLKVFPPAFLLVGLFMVWIDKKTIEKYFGESSGLIGYFASILLACTTLYPFVVVIPMAGALYKKGARLSIVLTYLGASAICRIPMTIFEASFLGIKFTMIRYVISLPLVVISSIIIERSVGNMKSDNDLQSSCG